MRASFATDGSLLSRRSLLRGALSATGAIGAVSLLAACGAAAPGTIAASGSVSAATGSPSTAALASAAAAAKEPVSTASAAPTTSSAATLTKAAKESVSSSSAPATSSAAAATATSASGSATAAASSGSKIVYGNTTDIKIMNPFLSTDVYSAIINGFIFDSLVRADPDTGAPYPWLAQKWDVSADGLTYTFHLRTDVKWQDGQPFTADDAKFTYETILDPKTQTVRKSLYDKVKAFTVVDPHTLQVELKQVYCPFLISSMTMGIVPKHLLQNSPDINKDPFNTKSPVGTGPYKFVEWASGDHVTLQANPDYWGGAPKIGQFIYKVVPNATVVAQQLKTGEIDMAGIEPKDLADLQKQPNLNVVSTAALNYEYVGYNEARPLFQDKSVRQALTYALNRQAMIDKILFSQGSILNAPMPASSWAYNPSVPSYAFDPAKAKAVLKAAGWALGSDGVQQKNGQPLKFTAIYSSNSQQLGQIMTVAQQQWKDIGAAVDLKPMDFDALLDVVNKTRDFDAVSLGWSLGLDPDQTSIWSSDQIKSGFNFIAYKSATVDKLLQEGVSLPGCDQAKRKAIYGQFQQTIAEDQPYTFLYSPTTLTVVNKRVHGTHITPFTTFWNIQNWTVD